MPVFEDLMTGLKDKGLDDILVIGGGVIPDDDVAELRKLGVAEVFGPGASAEAAIDLIREKCGSA